MNILYIGDVMGELGMRVVEQELPKLKYHDKISLVIAQAENVTDGKGMTPTDMQRLQRAGVDFFTGGNHSFDQPMLFDALRDPSQPVIRPANYPAGTPGLGYKYFKTALGDVLIISLLGQVVGKDANLPLDNPLKTIDDILRQEAKHVKCATIVNFHGDFSSEKVIIGHYLDGRVSAVIGDHWHVPTADAQVQPKGTAHMTDVGMCGALDSSLGVSFDSVLRRWRDGVQTKNSLETNGRTQFSALKITIDPKTQLVKSVQHHYIVNS